MSGVKPPIATEFFDDSSEPAIRGFIVSPGQSTGDAVVLTHGAGGDCRSRLLVHLSAAFADLGLLVLRCNLPFRQKRPFGPPFPGSAREDREGLRRAALFLRERVPGRVFLGGHSYGGRQSTILAADAPELIDGLLLLSYPLHPPRKPEELRTSHFPQLRTPALFVHGSRDPFGSWEQMRAALALIPARHRMLEIDGAGHDLLAKKLMADEVIRHIANAFIAFFSPEVAPELKSGN
jgi:predicted alpha/beta-hydrolase family hydrolase